ncbi:MAG: prepilin-type N-terminal cleavage/methylation domain-containing protein [Christensenellales bacterium]
MNLKSKKGFTLTELVIVIAVIAILAAVLIPTYTTLVRKANISADTQLCKNMNTALASEMEVESMQEVVDILGKAGYGIGKFNPTTENYRFVWEAKTNQILLLDENMKVVSNAKDYDTADWELWLTVKNASEVITNKKLNFNYYLANDYSGAITVTTLSSFSTGNNTLNGNLTVNTTEAGEISVDGVINGKLTVNTPNATVNQYGTVKNIDIQAVSANTFNLYGYADEIDLKVGHLVTKPASYTKKLVISADNVKIDNNSVIGEIAKGENVTLTESTVINNSNGYVEQLPSDIEVTNPDNFTSQISNLAQLCAFRDAVNNGAQFKNVTIQLTANITLEDGWTPIGAFNRDKSVKSFAGTFDGNNFTVSNLNNIGYVPSTNSLFQNTSTITGKKEYVYGFFGIVTGATIKNLKLANVNIDISNSGTVYGDKVGAIVGHSYGDLTINNCTVSGSISAYDGVGGLVGGVYTATGETNSFVMTNCTNNASVKGVEKASGIAGYVQVADVQLNNVINNGTVSAGSEAKTPNNQCYASGTLIYGAIPTLITLIDCENNGNVTVAYTIESTNGNNVAVNAYTVCNTNGNNYRGVTSINNCTNNGILTLNGATVSQYNDSVK